MEEPLSAKTLALVWATALWTRMEDSTSDLATFIFGLSLQGVRLCEWGDSLDVDGVSFYTKKEACLILLTKLIRVNGLKYLEDLCATPLELVSGIHEGSAHGCYLPLSIVGDLISVKKFLSLARVYPGLLPVVSLNKVSLEGNLSS